MTEWITETITFPVVLAFVIGIFVGQFANWCNYRWRLKKHPETVVKRSYWEAVIGVLVTIVLVWIMVSTNSARNCALTLNTSLQVEITAGKMEREAFQNAITQSLALPQDIQNLPNNDPRKVAVTKPITDEYLAKVAEARKIREDAAPQCSGPGLFALNLNPGHRIIPKGESEQFVWTGPDGVVMHEAARAPLPLSGADPSPFWAGCLNGDWRSTFNSPGEGVPESNVQLPTELPTGIPQPPR